MRARFPMANPACNRSAVRSSIRCWRSLPDVVPAPSGSGTRNSCPGASVRSCRCAGGGAAEFLRSTGPSITMEGSMFRAISLCLLGALLLGAADAPQKSAFDKPTLEAYVRHLYLLQPQLTVTIGDPKPSALPGFKDVRVRIAQGAQSQEVSLYVSNDGKKIVQGTFYDVASNPFKPELDKLRTQFQPALG